MARMNLVSPLPTILQGGMGVAISDWRLANAVARAGQLGVVSGTGIDTVFVRRLQDGDQDGNLRRAMERFPLPRAVMAVLSRFHRPTGRGPGEPYRQLSRYRQVMPLARQELTMLAAFVEVFLAKEGHDAPIGINLLTKIQLPTLPTLYGAMLAGVDYVIMGAGIPREIPAVLDQLASHRPARLRFEVAGLSAQAPEYLELDPGAHFEQVPTLLRRPAFLPIVASNVLATTLAKKASGRVDGFVIEGCTAGGHNAPPRCELRFNERGEPIYGERDQVDLARIAELGVPFWVAGGEGHPDRLASARSAGAAGVQVGTLFAYCDESGLAEPLKRSVLARALRGDVTIRTDPRASPTGYPFKIVESRDAPATVEPARERICDLGYLREAFVGADGKIGYRCAGEPVASYVTKGGQLADTVGRVCLCNGLLATAGFAQVREAGFVEPPIVTSGDDLLGIGRFLAGRTRYAAADVIEYLLG